MWSEIGEALLPKLLHLKTKKFNIDDSKTLQTDNVSYTHSCMHMYKDRDKHCGVSVYTVCLPMYNKGKDSNKAACYCPFHFVYATKSFHDAETGWCIPPYFVTRHGPQPVLPPPREFTHH